MTLEKIIKKFNLFEIKTYIMVGANTLFFIFAKWTYTEVRRAAGRQSRARGKWSRGGLAVSHAGDVGRDVGLNNKSGVPA
jgi:hypothetical protein